MPIFKPPPPPYCRCGAKTGRYATDPMAARAVYRCPRENRLAVIHLRPNGSQVSTTWYERDETTLDVQTA